MVFRLHLKNSKKSVLVDSHVYEFLAENPYYKSLNLIENFREHSSGCAVYQKSWKQTDGSYKTTTIYLHKMIAEKYVNKEEDNYNLVIAKNGNKLDCRVENLDWKDKAYVARRNPSQSQTNHRGIRKEGNKYRAEIYDKGIRIPLGSFDSLVAASEAYRRKSIELFGEAIEVINKKKFNLTSKRS